MNMPPEPPAEGVLIETARRAAGLSVREAARRAGISEGWWRQVVKGYQSLSGGAHGVVRDVPAETVAKMAGATGVTPAQLTEAGREDAARMLEARQHRDTAGAADALTVTRTSPPRHAPRDRPEVAFDGGDPDAVRPWRQQLLREIYEAVGLAASFGPGRELPEPSELPGAEETLALVPGWMVFPGGGERAERDARLWDDPRATLNEKLGILSSARRLRAEADEREHRRTGLIAAAGNPVLVAGTASRASS